MVRLFIRFDGGKYWQLNQQYHRANGPAIIYLSGYSMWWWHGQFITEFEHMILAGQEQLND